MSTPAPDPVTVHAQQLIDRLAAHIGRLVADNHAKDVYIDALTAQLAQEDTSEQ